MSVLIGIPVLIGLLMLQTSVAGSLPLLSGTVDLILLALVGWAVQERSTSFLEWSLLAGFLVALISSMPFMVPVVGYVLISWLAHILSRQVWQSPLIVMLLSCFGGTLIYHILSWGVLSALGVPLPVFDSLTLVILPAALLNLILALPMYSLMSELARMVYPEEASK